MSSRATGVKQPVVPREMLLTLAMVNTLQPVRFKPLADSLSKSLDRERVQLVMRILRKQSLLRRLGSGEYVVTAGGQGAFGTRALGRHRDINRMLHLFERSKGGRENG